MPTVTWSPKRNRKVAESNRKQHKRQSKRQTTETTALGNLAGMTNSGCFDFLSFRDFFLPSSQTSAEGLCKYLYMTLHMRTRHIGTRAATERRRSRRRRVGGEERERPSERASERGRVEREKGREQRGSRDGEGDGGEKTWTGKTGDGGRARLLRGRCVFAQSAETDAIYFPSFAFFFFS